MFSKLKGSHLLESRTIIKIKTISYFIFSVITFISVFTFFGESMEEINNSVGGSGFVVLINIFSLITKPILGNYSTSTLFLLLTIGFGLYSYRYYIKLKNYINVEQVGPLPNYTQNKEQIKSD